MNRILTSNSSLSARTRILTLPILALLLLAGCTDDLLTDRTGDLQPSVVVANEGLYGSGSLGGSLTVYDPEEGEAFQNAFQQANSRDLGGIIQSVTLAGGDLFVVNNAPDKIEVLNPDTFRSEAIITFGQGITPIHFVRLNEFKGYVSSLYDHKVYPLDLHEGEVVGEGIDVGQNPQEMVLAGNRLYVTNSGFGYDNTVTVINIETDEVLTTLDVGAGPFRILLDNTQRVWVLSGGLEAYDVVDGVWIRTPEEDLPGQVDVFDAASSTHLATIETGGSPRAMALDPISGRLWVANTDRVQRIDMQALELLEEESIARSFHAVGFFTQRGEVYFGQSRGYEQSGQVVIYTLEGVPADSFAVGVAPREFLFMNR